MLGKGCVKNLEGQFLKTKPPKMQCFYTKKKGLSFLGIKFNLQNILICFLLLTQFDLRMN